MCVLTGLVEERVDAVLVGDDADDTVVGEGVGTVSEETDGAEEVGNEDGLEDVELELAVRAGDRDGGVVAHDLRGDHGEGLALGGVDLAGHDGRSGLVLGERELAEAAAGAGAEVADVVGDLHERDGDDVEGARGLDDGVVGSETLKLVGVGLEGVAGDLGDLLGDLDVEALLGVQAL